MNGYEMMAESYRQLVKHGEIDKETADKEIRVYETSSIRTLAAVWSRA